MSPVSDLRTAEMPGLPGPGGHSDAMDDAMELARDFRADIHRVFAGHMTRGEPRSNPDPNPTLTSLASVKGPSVETRQWSSALRSPYVYA